MQYTSIQMFVTLWMNVWACCQNQTTQLEETGKNYNIVNQYDTDKKRNAKISEITWSKPKSTNCLHPSAVNHTQSLQNKETC